MSGKGGANGRKAGESDARAARLKAALKANIARRKDQARSRAQDAPAAPNKPAPEGPEQD